jgi:SAM-dependent methyltransferase
MKLSLSLRPNGIIKHSYQLNEAVEIYEASHYIDNNVKKEIANYILAKSLKKNLKILDAGIGGGDLVLLPLLDEMTEKKITAKIVGIDNSPPMLKRLDNALKQRGFSEISRSNEKIKYEKDGACETEVEIYIYDLEEYSLPKDLNNEKFDIILSILTLHHLKNWRLVLSTLIKHLNKDGVFVIFEWTKGIKLRDGNFVREDGTIDDFSGIDSSIVNFWKEFYAKRKEYHAWCPEICASDYTMVKKVLRKLPFVEDSKEFEWNEKENVNWSDIKKWIETKAYSNFYRGLTKKEQEDLIKGVDDKIKGIPTNKNWTEKLGCRVTIFKYLDELENEKIEEIILSSLNETSIFPKLIWEEEKYENLLQFSVLIVQHDFITENTLFFTMNKWNMIENTWDKLDKPMIFNRSCDKNGEFLKSMLVYYAFIEKFNISVTDLIFRDLRYKPILIIRKNSEWSVKKYINTLGMIEKLEIDIPSINPINFSVENINKEYYKPIKEDIFHVDFNAQEVKDCIQRIKNSISEDFFNTYKNEIKNGKSVLENTLLDEESPLLPDDKKLENFVKILLLHSLIILKWDTAVYIPAISLLPEKKETISFMSLGGIILFESNGNREDLNKKFLENRINVLKTVINLKFRSLGIAEYARKVKHETKRHALRSAVAAIMARNMSHNIGSHVLNYLSNPEELNNIWII